MDVKGLLSKGVHSFKINSPEILMAVGIVGLGATAYLSVRAGRKVEKDLAEQPPDLSLKEQAKQTWQHYIPPALAGTATIACMIGSNKASGNRTAAAVAAYSLLDKAHAEYKEKVIEQIGATKEQKVRDEIAQRKIHDGGKEAVVLGNGDFLCCEMLTMRYFMSDMETLRRAQNDINAKALNGVGGWIYLDDFYDLVGLPFTSQSSRLGWNSDRPLELEFTTTLTPENKPCLAVEYNYIKPIV